MPLLVGHQGREEFRNGTWIEMPPASPAHFRLIQRLQTILFKQLNTDRFQVVTTDFALGIQPGFQRCRNPDLVVFSREQLEHSFVQDNNLYAVPLLIVECLSPRDRKGKLPELLDDYRSLQAPEVWIIDPFKHLIDGYAFSTAGPAEPSFSVTKGIVVPSQLAGVSVDALELWQAFDGKW